MNFSELITQLVEKKAELEQFKTDHPDLAEGIQLVEEYMALFSEACRQCQPIQPIIYPVQPFNPVWTRPNTWQEYTIACNAVTLSAADPHPHWQAPWTNTVTATVPITVPITHTFEAKPYTSEVNNYEQSRELGYYRTLGTAQG